LTNSTSTGGATDLVNNKDTGSHSLAGNAATVSGALQTPVTNSPPTIASDVAAVSANEGGTATNTGTFHDADGNSTDTLTASIGTVTPNNALGTWSWSLGLTDGPLTPTTVTITDTDNHSAQATTTFTYAANLVPPTISLSGNATVNEGSPYTLNLGVITDPGHDTITSYTINWGDGVIDQFTGSPANTTATHTFDDGPANHVDNVNVTDDGVFLGGSLAVSVLNVAPTATLSTNTGITYGSAATASLASSTRILGELKKLGVGPISRTTIRNILKEAGLEPGPKRGEGTWNGFVQRHLQTLWACDFVSKRIWTMGGLVEVFVLFFLHVGSRRVEIVGMTTYPDQAWMTQQARNIAMIFGEQTIKPQYLIRDNDGKFVPQFDAILQEEGIEILRIPPGCPNMNQRSPPSFSFWRLQLPYSSPSLLMPPPLLPPGPLLLPKPLPAASSWSS